MCLSTCAIFLYLCIVCIWNSCHWVIKFESLQKWLKWPTMTHYNNNGQEKKSTLFCILPSRAINASDIAAVGTILTSLVKNKDLDRDSNQLLTCQWADALHVTYATNADHLFQYLRAIKVRTLYNIHYWIN